MPLVHFFGTSFGRTTSRRILLITAHCEGLNGWAECVAGENPYYSDEWVETAWATTRDYLAPAWVNRSMNQARGCVALPAHVRGHWMAKAALENAVWEVEARQKKTPLGGLIAGTRQAIARGASIGTQTS